MITNRPTDVLAGWLGPARPLGPGVVGDDPGQQLLQLGPLVGVQRREHLLVGLLAISRSRATASWPAVVISSAYRRRSAGSRRRSTSPARSRMSTSDTRSLGSSSSTALTSRWDTGSSSATVCSTPMQPGRKPASIAHVSRAIRSAIARRVSWASRWVSVATSSSGMRSS